MNIKEATAFCLAEITGKFETGGSWKRVSNNYDGYGPSIGILQFAWGVGSLQPLIKKFAKRVDLRTIFTQGQIRSLFEVMQEPVKTQRIYSNDNWFHEKSWIDIGMHRNFAAMARHPEFAIVQIEAAKKYGDKAAKLFEAYDFKTLRAFAIFFDIAVQNGGVRMSTQKEIFCLRRETRKTLGRRMTNKERLRNWIKVRASKSNPKWQKDVLSRKMAILNGKGVVHGKKYNFEGLCLDRKINPA